MKPNCSTTAVAALPLRLDYSLIWSNVCACARRSSAMSSLVYLESFQTRLLFFNSQTEQHHAAVEPTNLIHLSLSVLLAIELLTNKKTTKELYTMAIANNSPYSRMNACGLLFVTMPTLIILLIIFVRIFNAHCFEILCFVYTK